MFADAQQLLTKMKQDGSLRAVGCVAFYRAQSNGDDIKLYDELGSSIATLYGLRQQVGSQSIMISGLVSGIFIFSFFSYFIGFLHSKYHDLVLNSKCLGAMELKTLAK